ncbi:MAG: DUF3574 domain-containing protein, partial [Candidatus Binatia bacterium]
MGYLAVAMLFSQITLVIATAALLPACMSLRQEICRSEEQSAIHDSLYFGTAMPDGVVTGEEWAQFLGDVITPRFPQGLTVFRASGQWNMENGTMAREATYVVQIIHPNEERFEKN